MPLVCALRMLVCSTRRTAAIGVMGDLYSSAIGTTLLRIKEISHRPAEYDGVVCLGDMAESVDEQGLRRYLHRYFGGRDPLLSCDLQCNPAILRFSTHADAVAAIDKGLGALGGWIDTQYNERPYDDRGW